jgi:CheY-like chemotaxis protein
MTKTKIKVMIVEDEFIIIEDFKSILQQMEYDIISTATSGEAALEQLTKMKPDLILMDMKLSGKMTGIEAAKKVNELYDIPIIYITALF